MRLLIVLFLCLPFLLFAQTTPLAIPEDDWTSLFDRDSGWTGSDACYSIPFSGVEAPGLNVYDTTMFLFGDTFIGEVDSNGVRHNSKMIRNTIGILIGNQPDPQKIQFFWNTDEQGNPVELFKPTTPTSTADDWLWPMDGIRLGKRLYIYALRLYDPPGWLSFEINGIILLSFELNDQFEIISERQLDTPLFYKDSNDVELVFGQAIVPMMVESGNYGADGYLYILGPHNRPLQVKQMVAARVHPEDIENFNKYEFWDGHDWQSDITKSAAITDSISQEFSVTPLSDGRFVAVFEFGGWVCVRFSDDLTGPYQPVQFIYDCPEDTMYSGGMVYNAKAHPHLSGENDLLISYNVNTSDYVELMNNADTYRPRFIRYFWNDQPSHLKQWKRQNQPEDFTLLRIIPNPFNEQTLFEFSLTESGNVQLDVFDVLGQKVATLFKGNKPAGKHRIRFNAKNSAGAELSSGVYLLRFYVNGKVQTKKMILLK